MQLSVGTADCARHFYDRRPHTPSVSLADLGISGAEGRAPARAKVIFLVVIGLTTRKRNAGYTSLLEFPSVCQRLRVPHSRVRSFTLIWTRFSSPWKNSTIRH